MKTSAPNILNLLLGIAPVPVGSPQKAGSNPLDMLFGEVMQSVLGQGQISGVDPQAGLFGQISPRQSDKKSLPTFALPTVKGDGAVSTPTSRTSLFIETAPGVQKMPAKVPGWDFEGIESLPTAPVDVSSEAPSVVDQPNIEMSGVTTSVDSFINAQIQRLFISAEGQLPIGKYNVADYRVTDGQLVMELIPEETPEAKIQVSLPLAAVANSLSLTEGVSTDAARVALDSTAPQQSLATLFSGVRLKELVVKPAETTVPTATTPPGETVNQAADRVTPVEFKLFAENAGQEVVIKANLSRSDLRTRVMVGEQPRSTSVVPDQSVDGFVPLTARPATRVPGISRDGSVDNLLSSETFKSRFQGLAGHEPSSAKTSAEGMQGLPDFARTSTELTMPRERIDTTAVRYTLPQDARQMLKPNGQSIQLRIDPEHLGPARLNLMLKNDQLRAVVVVDSPQARQAVEGSLDRLVEALQRADIKVDYIQVTVDQQGTRNELFGHHEPRWSKPSRMERFPGLENEFTSPAAMTAAPMARSSYIGAGGVNVLA